MLTQWVKWQHSACTKPLSIPWIEFKCHHENYVMHWCGKKYREHCSPWPDIIMHNDVDTCNLHMYESFSKMLTPCPKREQWHKNCFFHSCLKLKWRHDTTANQITKNKTLLFVWFFTQHVISRLSQILLDLSCNISCFSKK